MPRAHMDWSTLCSLLFNGVITTTNIANQIFPLDSTAEETETREEMETFQTHS